MHQEENGPFNEKKCRFLIDWRVKAAKEEVVDAVHKYHILEEQNTKNSAGDCIVSNIGFVYSLNPLYMCSICNEPGT